MHVDIVAIAVLGQQLIGDIHDDRIAGFTRIVGASSPRPL